MFRVFIIILVLSAASVFTAFAQERAKVVVVKDPRIDSLIARRLELNKSITPAKSMMISGFRVQIFSGLDRKQVYVEQTKFKSRFPKIATYVTYNQANYKLRVGDFRTRMEAEKFMNELKKYYSSIFIFSELIILN